MMIGTVTNVGIVNDCTLDPGSRRGKMVIERTILLTINLLCFGIPNIAIGAAPVEFKLSWVSPQLTPMPIELMTAVDLDGDGISELFVTNFSSMSSDACESNEELCILRESNKFFFAIWEWDNNGMKKRWEKEWPPLPVTENRMRDRYWDFLNGVSEMQSWDIEGEEIIEAIPPYFQIQWKDGSFKWKEQYGPNVTKDNRVVSWIFPFQSFICHRWRPSYPYECVAGRRIFDSKKEKKVITILNDDKKTTVRVRKLKKSFPVEWDSVYSVGGALDPFNDNSPLAFWTKDGVAYLRQQHDGKGYEIKTVKADKQLWVNKSLVKAGKTQRKDFWEYWGYREVIGYDEKPVYQFRRAYLNEKETELINQDISFPEHSNFIGIGSFALEDIDNDGLDEIIFIEETGTRNFKKETVHYSDVRDYIRVLKWIGKGYQVVWTSPPINKRGSKVLVDDVMGNGKKQIVVGTGDGKILVWERK